VTGGQVVLDVVLAEWLARSCRAHRMISASQLDDTRFASGRQRARDI
jgi:hypothetical protein